MRRPIVLAIAWALCLASAAPALAESGACRVVPGACSYYLCRELQAPCGPEGYLLGFGYRYCELFVRDGRSWLSRAGRAWASETATCLQEKLSEVPLSASCGRVEDAAIEGHVECYARGGFCDLPPEDLFQIMIRLQGEMADPRMLAQALEIIDGCGWAR